MFVLAHSFFHIFNNCKDHNIPLPEISRQCLGKVGHSITLTSVTNGAGFLLAAIIPIPAMRQFALQARRSFTHCRFFVGISSILRFRLESA